MRQATCLRLALLPLCLLSAGWLTAPLAAQQQPKPVEGTMLIGTKTYTLTHALAYATKFGDEPATGVLFCERAIDVAKIAQALKDKDGSDLDVSPRSPHLKLTFNEKGELQSYFAYAAGTSLSSSAGKATSELKLEKDRATGFLKLEPEGEDAFRKSFNLKFSAPLLGGGAEATASAAGPANPLIKPGVTGKFVGNGKEAKLAFISAYSREAFADKPSLTIVMTEKDHSRDKKPDFKAGFGDYGNALIISCHEEDGQIFGCVVSHSAHSKRGFSSVGAIRTSDFQISGGQVQGQLKTDGDEEFFSDKWTVDLTFAAPFTSTAKPKTPAPEVVASGKSDRKEMTRPKRDAEKSADKPTEKPAAEKPAAARLKVKDLAIVKDVPNVDFKKLVQHVNYDSDKDYKSLATEIAKKLAAQGWQADGRDLIGVSAIIKRTRGEASLTIFVKPVPGATGSKVVIFTEGLDWEE